MATIDCSAGFEAFVVLTLGFELLLLVFFAQICFLFNAPLFSILNKWCHAHTRKEGINNKENVLQWLFTMQSVSKPLSY